MTSRFLVLPLVLGLVLLGAASAVARPGLLPEQADDYRGKFSPEQYEGRHWLRVVLMVPCAALSAVDLVLGRSGSTVWEVAAAGRPAIFVPYPFATGDHQAANAEHFVRAGGAIMVRELELDDVAELVRSLLDDEPRLRRMSQAMLAAARPNAAEEIADALVALARR